MFLSMTEEFYDAWHQRRMFFMYIETTVIPVSPLLAAKQEYTRARRANNRGHTRTHPPIHTYTHEQQYTGEQTQPTYTRGTHTTHL